MAEVELSYLALLFCLLFCPVLLSSPRGLPGPRREAWVQEKRAELGKEKVEVYKHYEALPDMDSAPGALPGLPSPAQLFAPSDPQYAP